MRIFSDRHYVWFCFTMGVELRVNAYQRPKPERGECESILTIWLWVPYGSIGGNFFPTLSNEVFGLGVI